MGRSSLSQPLTTKVKFVCFPSNAYIGVRVKSPLTGGDFVVNDCVYWNDANAKTLCVAFTVNEYVVRLESEPFNTVNTVPYAIAFSGEDTSGSRVHSML